MAVLKTQAEAFCWSIKLEDSLSGGKVKRGELLVKALKREVHEETGLRVQIGSLLGVLDRHDKDVITLLFAAIPTNQSIEVGPKQRRDAPLRFVHLPFHRPF